MFHDDGPKANPFPPPFPPQQNVPGRLDILLCRRTVVAGGRFAWVRPVRVGGSPRSMSITDESPTSNQRGPFHKPKRTNSCTHTPLRSTANVPTGTSTPSLAVCGVPVATLEGAREARFCGPAPGQGKATR